MLPITLAALGLLAAAPARRQPDDERARRALQETLSDYCPCADCLNKHECDQCDIPGGSLPPWTVEMCERSEPGMDCSCVFDCKCRRCVEELGQSVADCESLGLDCGCYRGADPHRPDGPCADFDDRTQAVNDECCDEPTEDCSSGPPATCNLGCAHVLLPYFDDCMPGLGIPFLDIIALCRAAEVRPAVSFPGSQILTPEADAALAELVAPTRGLESGFFMRGGILLGANRPWQRCFSSFTDDSSDASAFHAQCDQHTPTVVIVRHGPVPQTSTAGAASGHPEYDTASSAWVDGGSWIFGGYVSTLCICSFVCEARAN